MAMWRSVGGIVAAPSGGGLVSSGASGLPADSVRVPTTGETSSTYDRASAGLDRVRERAVFAGRARRTGGSPGSRKAQHLNNGIIALVARVAW